MQWEKLSHCTVHSNLLQRELLEEVWTSVVCAASMCPRRQSQSQRQEPSWWDLGQPHPSWGPRGCSLNSLLRVRHLWQWCHCDSRRYHRLPPVWKPRFNQAALQIKRLRDSQTDQFSCFCCESWLREDLSSLHRHVNKAFLQDSVGRIPRSWPAEHILWTWKRIKPWLIKEYSASDITRTLISIHSYWLRRWHSVSSHPVATSKPREHAAADGDSCVYHLETRVRF